MAESGEQRHQVRIVFHDRLGNQLDPYQARPKPRGGIHPARDRRCLDIGADNDAREAAGCDQALRADGGRWNEQQGKTWRWRC